MANPDLAVLRAWLLQRWRKALAWAIIWTFVAVVSLPLFFMLLIGYALVWALSVVL